MIYTIQNSHLSVAISTKGAELQSLLNKNTGIEHMWGADPAFWSKSSPVLFPVVGGLKNNQYSFSGSTYTLNRHGFARESEFVVTSQQKDSIAFTLTDSEITLQHYPFHFSFTVTYTLQQNSLHVTYTVINTGDETMFFSVGGHPAFKAPVVAGTTFTDYYLEFSHAENAGRWPLSPGGQIETYTQPLLNNTNILPLTKQLFYQDALVFKHLQSNAISIKSGATPHGLTVTFNGFPYMGIWNAKDADFVCIEPWCGIADSVDASGELQDKEGINALAAKETFERTWMVEVF
ncbi:MAG TPA: aldose 1-epimerase family protein [Chitinophagaceae bacterium]|nr:aldose 1-epimerase family protein [Chitinophagaceae bacterium]